MTAAVAPAFDLAATALTAQADAAIDAIAAALRDNLCIVSCSFGKDSAIVLSLAMTAYERCRDAGHHPGPLYVGHSLTGVENPAMTAYAREAMDAIAEEALARNIDLRFEVYEPTAAASFPVRVIGHGFRPVYPGTADRWCSVDWKVRPAERRQRTLIPSLRAELTDALAATPAADTAARADILAQLHRISDDHVPVAILGTRRDESTRRNAAMASRQEDANTIATRTVDGKVAARTLSPIADWTTDEVMSWYGYATPSADAGPLRACMDTRPLLDIYRDANEGACTLLPGQDHKRSACGSRTGCWTCCAVAQDRSLQAMTAEPKYAHIRPLLKIRDYLSAIEHDLTKRRPFARTVEDNTIRLYPDALSADTVKLLYRAILTADRREALRAQAFAAAIDAGTLPDDAHLGALAATGRTDPAYIARMRTPQFQTITLEHVLLIDAYWALYGISTDLFEATKIFHEVITHGLETDLPTVIPTAPTKLPAPQYIDLSSLADDSTWGLTDPMTKWTLAVTPATAHHLNPLTAAAPGSDATTVDLDKASEFVFDIFPALARSGSRSPNHNPFLPLAGLGRLIRAGIIRVNASVLADWERMARRSQLLRNAGLYGTPDLATVPTHSTRPTRHPNQPKSAARSVHASPQLALL